MSLLVFLTAVNAILVCALGCLVNQISYADSLILKSERKEDWKENVLKRKKLNKSKGMNVSLEKTKRGGEWLETKNTQQKG